MWWEGWEWEELRDGRNRSWPSAGSKEEAGGETDLSLREEAVVIVIVVMVETGSQMDVHVHAGNLLLQCSLMVSTTMPR